MSQRLYFLGGILVGSLVTGIVLSQHYLARIKGTIAIYSDTIENVSKGYRFQIENLEDVDEACAELYERNMELETAVVVLNQDLLQAEANCLWRLRNAEKERCE